MMRIRADTKDKEKIPELGDKFKVIRVDKKFIWWIIELEKIKD
ncbi:unnamed protein product [marine sediment metagenome]|uniref:Uncharacterized protein n=1 Tax=marine sediment metagenome TaxID=412755 RepID=X1GW31_9ZZZZ